MNNILLALVGAAALLGATLWLTHSGPMHGLRSSTSVPFSVVKDFNSWKIKYGKRLAGADESYRLQIFYQNTLYVQTNTNEKTQFAINQFGDLTNEEFATSYMGYKNLKTSSENLHANTSKTPNSVDWRQKGKVSDIKD